MNDHSNHVPLPWFESEGLSHLQLLLMRAGWERRSGHTGLDEIWTPISSGTHSNEAILVPLDSTKADFKLLTERAYDALRRYIRQGDLERLESQLQQETSYDLVPTSWKKESGPTPGSIQWIEGQSMHALAARQMIAAAKSTVEPRAYLGRANAYLAQDFISRAILAPSGMGSYVVTALTPVHERLFMSPPPDPKPGKQPERPSIEAIAVVRTLDSALSAVIDALDQRNLEDSVVDIAASVKRGVSYELVSALAEFVGGSHAAVTIPRHAWSRQAHAHEHVFNPRDTEVLAEAAKRLDAAAEPTEAFVTGVVTLMEHEPNSDERTVRIFTTSRGPVRRVRLQLSEEDYRDALEAHKEGSLVRVVGTLKKVGKFWHMDARRFEALSADESEAEVERDETDLFSEER